jgi:hypothetical protein
MTRVLIGCAIALSALVASGCASESEGPILKGRLLDNGKPYTLDRVSGFEIKFVTVEGVGPQKKSYVAIVERDGTFTVTNPFGRRVPTGSYKVTIQCDLVTGKDGRWHDALNGAFTDQNSPLVYEVRSGVTDVTIDIGKKTIE